jgi:anti-anti-sigma factor
VAHVSLVSSEGTSPTVITVVGELDFATVPGLLHRLNHVTGDVELDCSRLTFLDCNGLDALIGAHRGCEARGSTLTIRNLAGVCLRVLRMARADSLLNLVWADDSEEAAALRDSDGGPSLAVVSDAGDGLNGELARAQTIIAQESGLATLVTLRADGAAQATVVNAGIVPHPGDGEAVIGVVVRGHAKKLTNLRARPRATVLFRSGWDWVTFEGTVELCGPDDVRADLSRDDELRLIRSIYAAAVGGKEEDWAGLDATFESEEHTAVLIRPVRAYSNRDR